MYVVEQTRRHPTRSPPPSYDVKIVGGKRVVIWHDKRREPKDSKEDADDDVSKKANNRQEAKKVGDEEREDNQLYEDYKKAQENSTREKSKRQEDSSSFFAPKSDQNRSSRHQVEIKRDSKSVSRLFPSSTTTTSSSSSHSHEKSAAEKQFGGGYNYEESSIKENKPKRGLSASQSLPDKIHWIEFQRQSLAEIEEWKEREKRQKKAREEEAEAEMDDIKLNETYTKDKKGKNPFSDDAPYMDDRELKQRVQEAVKGINERTLGAMLMEMRKTDRDRDRILRPIQIKMFLEKYKIPVFDIWPQLEKKFNDKSYPGNTNYEDLTQFFLEAKSRANLGQEERFSAAAAAPQAQVPSKISLLRQRQMEAEEDQNKYYSHRAYGGGDGDSFNDRQDAGLLLDLEKCVMNSPKFEIDKFKSALVAKDLYGNDQVSRQHVIQAADVSGLIGLDKATLGKLLQASDMTKRGIYNINLIVGYLERAKPHAHALQLQFRRSKKSTIFMHMPLEKYVHKSPKWESIFPLKNSAEKKRKAEEEQKKHMNVAMSELRRGLENIEQELPGYLARDDALHFLSTFNDAFQTGFTNTLMENAVDKSVDGLYSDLVNIQLLVNNVEKSATDDD